MTCKKHPYKTIAEAKAALDYIKKLKEYLPGRMEKRIYYCKRCEAYHLTKQEAWGK